MNEHYKDAAAMCWVIITMIGSIAYVVHVGGDRIYTVYPMWINVGLVGLTAVIIASAGYRMIDGVIKGASNKENK